VPESGGGLVVSWHPNALVDPGLILSYFPKQIVFGARHGLFRVPLLGTLMRAIGTVPIYRRADVGTSDENVRRKRNQESLDALAEAVSQGSFAALFPEGVSHDEPHPVELKTGAARLYYRACELTPDGEPTPVILPVGLHYDKKRVFDSNVLIVFHPPLPLPDELLSRTTAMSEDELRERNRALTSTIEDALHHVVHATENWEIHNAMQRARKLVRAERAQRAGRNPGRPSMKERVLGFSRLWAGYRSRVESHPDEVEELTRRVQGYDAELLALGLEDHELDAAPAIVNARLAVLVFLQAFVVYLLLPPIVLIGLVANLPAAGFVWLVTKRAASAKKDEASLKVLIATLALPMNWVLLSLLAVWGGTSLGELFPRFSGAPLLTGLLAFLLSAIGAYIALHYQRLAQQTARAFRVRITRMRRSSSVARLLEERSELHDRITELAEGLELPNELSLDANMGTPSKSP
jgi:1-acyl-sn-glycerol-3-phosphate acyltransferase